LTSKAVTLIKAKRIKNASALVLRSDEKLHAVPGNDMTHFNDPERLVIELADALTDTPSNVSDDLYARLRNQFSDEQLMQLGGHIAFENHRARWNRLFNVESDNLYQGTVS
jgi:alkylhydroperoxidase family enzyme